MEPSTARKHPFVGSWVFSGLLFLTAVLIIAASLARAANSDRLPVNPSPGREAVR